MIEKMTIMQDAVRIRGFHSLSRRVSASATDIPPFSPPRR